MKTLIVRPSPALRRRLAHAAAHHGVSVNGLVKNTIEGWARMNPRPEMPAVDGEIGSDGPYSTTRYPIGDRVLMTVRVAAVEQSISVSTLVVRILFALVPHEIEILAASITDESTSTGRTP